MRRKKRSKEVFLQKKRDTEMTKELIVTENIKKSFKNINVDKLANNPRPKYEIYPGE